MYYGYAFESYCTSAHPPKKDKGSRSSGWGEDVDTNVQWCSVVKTKLADTRIVIGGEVDCVRGVLDSCVQETTQLNCMADRFDGSTDSFVELKTSLAIRGPQDEARFEKCVHW